MEMAIKNEEMDKLKKKEVIINNFVRRLLNGQYKAVLYNGLTPILKDEVRLIEFVLSDLDEESILELNNDILVIHNKNEKVELIGCVEMSDYEIVTRKYLDKCECTLIIKDDEMQVEFREDNFINIEDKGYYDKCKNIIDIDIFIGEESDPVWRMNWDAIWVTYKDTRKELWQRP